MALPELMLSDTLTGEKSRFVPIDPPQVKMYVCGPTVYDEPHLGHAKTAIFFDIVRRYLGRLGYSVFYVANITDIDDKIINRALEEGVSWEEVAKRYEEEYFRAMDSLKILPATVNPRATNFISRMIEFISGLLSSGKAYITPDGVYFSVESFEKYGLLSKIRMEDLIRDPRIEKGINKRNPADFALWKFAKPNEPRWKAPWGDGRPGWHIECSTMIYELMGPSIDIHGGGSDLIFPHHENEIAQMEALTGRRFVKYWMHVGLLQVRGEKMAKSLKNYFSVRSALEDYDADAIRIFLTSAHYRKPLEFSLDSMNGARERVRSWKDSAMRALRYSEEGRKGELNEDERKLKLIIDDEMRRFFLAMSDDFNTPLAYSSIDLISAAASRIVSESLSHNLASEAFFDLAEILSILGIDLMAKRRVDERGYIEALIEVRKQLREIKMYDIADRIRKKLMDMGVMVEDRNGETIWWIKE
ncbi:MAG: cysteine--tRNA ligase [Thermoproteota archaeon]|nr:MAG: cysteine--tRNA ligase [Candidatus Korarchaeota archaeon]